MLECKVIDTPMASKLMPLCDSSSETDGSTMYRQMIGSFMYVMNAIPYICFSANTLSQFLMDSRHVDHLVAAKKVLRYLKGTVDYGLKYDVN